jgi:hypothetical protein
MAYNYVTIRNKAINPSKSSQRGRMKNVLGLLHWRGLGEANCSVPRDDGFFCF